MGQIQKAIEEKLLAAMPEARCHVENQSHLHAGHAGHDGSGESHFHLVIHWEGFMAMNRLGRERHVQQILAQELPHIHALSMKLSF